MLATAVSESLHNESTAETEGSSMKLENVYECRVGETSKEPTEKPPLDVEEAAASLHQKNQSITRGSSKEINFNSADGDSHEPSIGSYWWANKKAVEKESWATIKQWAFFPMMQPGVSKLVRYTPNASMFLKPSRGFLGSNQWRLEIITTQPNKL